VQLADASAGLSFLVSHEALSISASPCVCSSLFATRRCSSPPCARPPPPHMPLSRTSAPLPGVPAAHRCFTARPVCRSSSVWPLELLRLHPDNAVDLRALQLLRERRTPLSLAGASSGMPPLQPVRVSAMVDLGMDTVAGRLPKRCWIYRRQPWADWSRLKGFTHSAPHGPPAWRIFCREA
jgi:hypothetical protein